RKLEALVEHWQHTAERFRVQWQESEWYLGETRATVAHVQEQLTSMRETYGWLEHAYREVEPRLHEAAHERDDANRDLVEARAAHEALLRQHLEMAAELAGARHDVEAMRRFAETVQQKLDAERSRGDALAADRGHRSARLASVRRSEPPGRLRAARHVAGRPEDAGRGARDSSVSRPTAWRHDGKLRRLARSLLPFRAGAERAHGGDVPVLD